MQKQKNIRLLIILGAIATLISVAQLLLQKDDGLSVDKKQFTLNQQTVITDVILNSKSSTNKLSYINGSWQVNSKYELDQNMRDVFFSVLSQLEIRRVISASQNDSIVNLAKKEGTHVSILNNQDTVKSYQILGDNDSQTSYLVDNEGIAFSIHIPGYRSYVAGIFEVPEADWRSRRVFSALFTNLNILEISYPKESIEFRYKNSFFEIVDADADSTQLIGALENLLFLQTDQYLQSSDYSKYLASPPFQNKIATITTTQLSRKKETVSLYAAKNESAFYVGITSDSTFCLFNKKRLNKILVKKSDFQ